MFKLYIDFNLIKYVFYIYIIFSFSSILLSDTKAEQLVAPEGFNVKLFAKGIDAPRQMVEGNSYIFVAGIRGNIYALKDTDGDNQIDLKVVVASELNNSRGIALKDGDLYFSEVDKIWVIKDIEENLEKDQKESLSKILFNNTLPNESWHGGKWLMFGPDNNLYTNVGAPCNVCLDGVAKESLFASLIKLQDNSWQTVAKGVRNSVGFDWHPQTKLMYFGDNGRDWLGDDSPSCELNILKEESSFFGFPFLHATDTIDPQFGEQISEINQEIVLPVLEIGAHVAPTGVAFYNGNAFPPEYKNTLFMALHGSWNRSKKSGYKVIAVQTDMEGNILNVKDFLTGWLEGQKAWGRPSAPLVLRDGSLLVSDDKYNAIFRITYD